MTAYDTQFILIQLITKAFGDITYSKGNAVVVCPICAKKDRNYRKKKLAIRLSDHVVHCWVCGYRSHNLLHLLKAHTDDRNLTTEYGSSFPFTGSTKAHRGSNDPSGDYFGDDNSDAHHEKALRLPDGFQLLAPMLNNRGRRPWAVKKSFDYLSQRGLLNERDLWYWKFGIVLDDGIEARPFWNRIIIPSFDTNGKLNYWTARGIDDRAFPRYFNPNGVKRKEVIFNELNIDWKKELVLVEGPFDLFKCTDNATCILGSEVKEDFRLFQKIVENNTSVTLAFDSDAKKKTLKFIKLLQEYDISVQAVEIPNEYEDVGAMTQKQFIEVKEQYTVRYTNRSDFLTKKIQSITSNLHLL